MTKLSFAFVAIMVLALFAGPSAFAAPFCVIRDGMGHVDVTDRMPVNDWSLFSTDQCFNSIDVAQRVSGVGTGGPIGSEPIFSDTNPR